MAAPVERGTFKVSEGGATAHLRALLIDQRVSFNLRQCGGQPCIRGLRIRVADILEMLAQGVEQSEILADFPNLEAADIMACLYFAAKRAAIARLPA